MTVNAKKAVPKDLIDSLLADYKKPEDLIGENGLLKQLTSMRINAQCHAAFGDVQADKLYIQKTRMN